MIKTLVRGDEGDLQLPSRGGSRRDPGGFHGSRQISDRDISACNGLVSSAQRLSRYYTNLADCDASLDSNLGRGI